MVIALRAIVVNDDSYLSPGLYLLYESVKDLGDVLISSTGFPRSATGREITFSRPLRYAEKYFMGYRVYVTDGTPIDALHLAIEVLGFKPDVVLSGVNVGDNLSLQHIFYSGTLAVAIEAALMGIPAIAFSADVEGYKDFSDQCLKRVVKYMVPELVNYISNFGLPPGVDVLSVNIPKPSNLSKCVKVAKAADRKSTR